MNNKFDELAKSMAQSVTRKAALKKFGLGIVGIALAALGLPNKAQADKGGNRRGKRCNHCIVPFGCDTIECEDACIAYCSGRG